MGIDLGLLKPGDELPARQFGPITRTVLALYACGSGDHNPMHIDIDFARRAGAPDVFAHGMLSMAYLTQYLLRFAPQQALRTLSARFTAITPVNASVTCAALVIARGSCDTTLSLSARTDGGIETVTGRAVIAL